MMRIPLFALLGLLSLGACAGSQRQTHVASFPTSRPRWEVHLKNGVPDGVSRTWHPNGQLASLGSYRNGARDGEWRFWNAAGAEVRRETYRHGRRVTRGGVARAAGGPAAATVWRTAGPSLRAAVRNAPGDAAARATDSYVEIGAATGLGATNAARRVEGDDGSGGMAVSLGLHLLRHQRALVYGGNVDLSSEVFGPTHSHLGGVVGLGLADQRADVELLGEGGLHVVSNIGDDLFTTSSGNNEAALPYVGGQLRLNMDPGAPGHLMVALAIAARTDLARTERDVMTTSCFLGCYDEVESWRIGGQSMDLTLGLSYQFE